MQVIASQTYKAGALLLSGKPSRESLEPDLLSKLLWQPQDPSHGLSGPALGSCQPPWDEVTRAWEAHEGQKTLLQHLVDSSTPAAQFVPSMSSASKGRLDSQVPSALPSSCRLLPSEDTFSRTDPSALTENKPHSVSHTTPCLEAIAFWQSKDTSSHYQA